jgi:hypothetical protein
MVVVADDEKDMSEPHPRCVDEAQRPVALFECRRIVGVGDEAARMAEVARDDQQIAAGQRPTVVLGLEVKVAHIATAHARGARER